MSNKESQNCPCKGTPRHPDHMGQGVDGPLRHRPRESAYRRNCIRHTGHSSYGPLYCRGQALSSTAYISRVYGLSLTTRPSTSTQACALNGICCAPMIIWAGTPCSFSRVTVAADLCRQGTSFQYQMQA